MKRQFFALGLTAAAIGGFAIMQPAFAVFETEDNTVRAQDITSLSSPTNVLISGGVKKSSTFSKNDPVDMFTITVPLGKQLSVKSVDGQHPNNVVMELIRDENKNAISDSNDRRIGFINGNPGRQVAAAPIRLNYIVKVSLQDPRAEVSTTNYRFLWSVK